jgi:hypothetical protein
MKQTAVAAMLPVSQCGDPGGDPDSMEAFTVRPIEAADIPSAYPLAREMAPDLTPAAWKRLARRTAGAPRSGGRASRGILIAWAPDRPFLSGLLLYRVDRDLRHGRILVADPVISMDLLDSRPALDALLGELDPLAGRLDCRKVRSVVHTGRGEMTRWLIDAGYGVEGALFHKVLTGGAPPAAPFPVMKAGTPR